MSEPASPRRVGIAYGWSEGPLLGRLLRKSLRDHGYTTTNNLAEADIIIAHSGGCFVIPLNARAELIMLVGLPYWPGRHPIRNLRRKFQQEIKDGAWIKKTIANGYYLLLRPDRSLKLWQSWRREMYPNHPTASVMAVRNQEDAFQHQDELLNFAKQQGWRAHIMPGQHDDLWANPKPYVDLIAQALE